MCLLIPQMTDLEEDYRKFQHLKISVVSPTHPPVICSLDQIQPFFINSTFNFTHNQWPSFPELLRSINESSLRKHQLAQITFLTRVKPDTQIEIWPVVIPVHHTILMIDETASLLSIAWSIPLVVSALQIPKIKWQYRLINFVVDLIHD